MWRRIGALIVKELLAVWRDPKSRVVLVVPPMVQLLVFSFAATQEVRNVEIAVLNQDWGRASRDLVARFEGSPTFVEIRRLGGVGEIAPAMDGQDAIMVLHIGQDFSRNLAAGRPAAVQAILDGRRSNAAQLVLGYASEIVERFNADLPARRGAAPAASEIVPRVWFNPNLESTWHTVPSLVAILTTMIGLVVTALSVARERELGTFEQLLVSPLGPVEILIGKTVPAILIGLGEGTLILVVGVLAFGVPLTGSLPLLYLGMLIFLAAVVGVGLFISSLVRTQQQAILGAFAFMVPAILLSGFASPIENMPDWLQWLTQANPIRHFLVIVKGVLLKDMPPGLVLQSLWPMALIALVTLSGASWLFRRRLQ